MVDELDGSGTGGLFGHVERVVQVFLVEVEASGCDDVHWIVGRVDRFHVVLFQNRRGAPSQ